jgi:hypothetical protein
MDQHLDEFSKSLAESVARRESRPGATAMVHPAICLLAYLAAVSGILGVAQAGSITYDFVNPITGTDGYDLRGSITVDSAGISAAPIDLTSAMVQSWHISVFNSSNVLQFALDSSSNVLFISPTDINGSFLSFAPRITSSTLFLPTLPFPPTDSRPSVFTAFALRNSPLTNETSWFVETILRPTPPHTYFRSALALAASSEVFSKVDDLQSDFTIAVVEPASTVIPEPSSMIVWGIGGLLLTIASLRCRRRADVTWSAQANRAFFTKKGINHGPTF